MSGLLTLFGGQSAVRYWLPEEQEVWLVDGGEERSGGETNGQSRHAYESPWYIRPRMIQNHSCDWLPGTSV